MKTRHTTKPLSTRLRRGATVALPLALALLGATATLGARDAAAATVTSNPAETVQITSAKSDPLPLYAAPGDAQPVTTTHVAGLPWDVLESQKQFFRVKLDGKNYWVDGMSVHLSRAVKAKCEKSAGGAINAADLGASTNRCQ
ncbi:hypothetical protein [Paraburkholderia acidisoli]|uniref:SH3 domain-containing protein n=1 Tax=Paraburkholderia acidisoli TaxID=2571748 RepID=A0A7Z2GGC0_9BURK|nr:hypothetical protein [Paraburkholderia acidisoli]QGZ60904.1 hypothetical protein FAZ98_03665 [Paraburkholderia acidisoli]